jgi:hypothetical protein
VVETEMAFDARRNFHGGGRIARRAFRDWRHSHQRRFTAQAFDNKDDDARAMLEPFVLS